MDKKPTLREEWERWGQPQPRDDSPYWGFHGSGENRWDLIAIIGIVIAVIVLSSLFD